METSCLIDISPPISYLANSGSWVMGKNAVGQSVCRIIYNVIFQEGSEWWTVFLACR